MIVVSGLIDLETALQNEHLPCSPEDWVRRIHNRYGAEIVVVGLGTEGALLADTKQSISPLLKSERAGLLRVFVSEQKLATFVQSSLQTR